MIEDIMKEAAWAEDLGVWWTTYFDLLCIVGNLAISLKHPKNIGPSSRRAKELGAIFAEKIHSRFGDQLPAELLQEWADLGFIASDKVH